MFNRLLSLALAGLLISMVTPAPASAQAGSDPGHTLKVRAKISRVGTGKQARVEVKLRDKQTLKGYVGEIAEDHFSLVDAKHGTVTAIPYDQVERVKNRTQSPFLPLALGGAVIGGLLIVVAVVLRGS